jgi:hypothetical protein
MNYIIKQSQPQRIWLAYADYENYGLKEWLEANFISNQDGFCHVCRIDRQGTTVSTL